MPSNVHAISKPSEEIALTYGSNVSKGIQAMEEKIKELTSEVESLYNQIGGA